MNIRARIIFAVILMIAASPAYAQQNVELAKLTSDLQKAPTDQLLRQKIIKLALETKPAAATPREAVEIQGAADYIVANAKNEADFAKAAAEFEKAIALAPWNAAFYYNAAVMYEKAKMPEKALPNYEFYLLAAPNADDSTEVIRKVGAMKFAAREADEKRLRDEAQQRDAAAAADRERQRTGGLQEFRRLVEGKIFRLLLCNGYQGCTQQEFNGKNWGADPSVIGSQPVMRWEFRSDAAYGIVREAGKDRDVFRVIPNGPSVQDVIWEMRWFDNYGADKGYIKPPGYFSVSSDISVIITGVAPPEQKKKRQFWMYKTP